METASQGQFFLPKYSLLKTVPEHRNAVFYELTSILTKYGWIPSGGKFSSHEIMQTTHPILGKLANENIGKKRYSTFQSDLQEILLPASFSALGQNPNISSASKDDKLNTYLKPRMPKTIKIWSKRIRTLEGPSCSSLNIAIRGLEDNVWQRKIKVTRSEKN